MASPLGNDNASVIVSAQLKLSRQSLRFVARQFRAQRLKYQQPKRTVQPDTPTKRPISYAGDLVGVMKTTG